MCVCGCVCVRERERERESRVYYIVGPGGVWREKTGKRESFSSSRLFNVP